jgi:hypothetical protein
MKLTKNHKIIIGVVGLGILAYATKKYWMPKKKTTATTPTGSVSTQSAPTPATPVASKREEMLNKLTNPTGAKVEGGSMSIEMPKELFASLTDKELEFLLMIGEIDKEVDKNLPASKSKEDFLKKEENKKKEAEAVLLKKGYKMSDVENMMNIIGKKMQEQAGLLESKLSKK